MPLLRKWEAGTLRRLRGALAHLRPVVPASTGAVLAGETICIVMTVMALRTCSTVKMMLGTVVAQAQKLVPPATRTVQDLKVHATDMADAS